jgi:hypothetical protein
MPSQAERHAWHHFREEMSRQQAAFDGQVPVALLCASVCHGPGHDPAIPGGVEVDVDLMGALAILRPPGSTPAMVADLLERAAQEIRAGRLKS